jgi:Cu(I)/Ag(I) efflux system protein CusF
MKRTLIAALVLMSPVALAQMGGVKAMDMKAMEKKDASGQTHKATGVVTKMDAAKSRVTIGHEPVQSMNWPAMTMAFTVNDKSMLDKMPKDSKVDFEFVQQGRNYVVTSVK